MWFRNLVGKNSNTLNATCFRSKCCSCHFFLTLSSSACLDLCKIYLSLVTTAALRSETFLLRAGATDWLHTPRLEPVSLSSLRGYTRGSLPSPHVSTLRAKLSTSFAFPKDLDHSTTLNKSAKQVKTVYWVTLTLSPLLGAGSIKKSGQMLYRYLFWSTLMNLTPGWSFKGV